jgi:hypothetical protein
MEPLSDTAFESLETGADEAVQGGAAAAPGICFVAWTQVADEVYPDHAED